MTTPTSAGRTTAGPTTGQTGARADIGTRTEEEHTTAGTWSGEPSCATGRGKVQTTGDGVAPGLWTTPGTGHPRPGTLSGDGRRTAARAQGD